METEQKCQFKDAQCKSMCQQIGIILDGNLAVRCAILIVSIIQIICGAVAIGAWSEMLVAGVYFRYHPITTGAGIWAGAYALVPGILGVLCWMKSCNVIARMRMFYAHFGTSMGLFGVEGQLIRFSVEAMACSVDKGAPTLACKLTPKFHNLAIVSLVMAAVLMVTAVCVMGYYFQVVCVELKKARRTAEDGKAQLA